MEVGLKIKKYLDENGISQAHISRETRIDSVKLNLALNGKRRFTFYEYSVICGVLGLDTNFFLKSRLPNDGGEKM
ncbi:MAG: helix-turn-helix transcriptional regulator, partial [Clostridiaceae bacterium]|nr:helix-turn-helix transcriptional regulator [Clostridiaceae bacterium]